MFKPLSFPILSTTSALGMAALIALHAEAAASTEAQTLATLPQALAGFLRGSALFFLAPLALAAVLWHRTLIELGAAALAQIEARMSLLRPALPPPEALAPAKHLPLTDDLAATLKARMTAVHRQLRHLAPELLLALAEFRAAQTRLLAESNRRPDALATARGPLVGALVQVENATRKLSVVLGSEAKEYALGAYADTLEKLTGETMDCLIGLRAKARGVPSELQLAGETRHA